MTNNINQRINSMYNRDRLFATLILIALWITIAFVYIQISKQVSDGNIQITLTIGALLLLLFNTASIYAMLRHYAQDKEFIYKIDIRHLDAARSQKGGAASQHQPTQKPTGA
ncbi:MAG: hypothetical protein R3E62_03545 [Pseudomonadales bacterium]